MGLFDKLKTSLLGRAMFVQPEAAALPPTPLPKPPKGAVTLPAWRKTLASNPAELRKVDRQLANTDRLSARTLGTTAQVVREFYRSSPDLSSAVSFMLRTGIPEEYTVIARDMEGVVNVDTTKLANELLRRLTYMGNVDGSYGAQQGLQSLSEQLGLELILDGAACLEVALDKARIPASFNPVSVPTLVFFEEDASFKMSQKVGGDLIDLDIPTIIYVNVDQMQNEVYPSSYIESAIQPILADVEFNNDTRRALKRAVLPRLTAIIDSEKVKKMTPPDILADNDKFTAYKSDLVSSIESVLNGMAPEDALVSYDSISYSFIDGGHDPAQIIERIQGVLNSKLVSGAKTVPVILGHGSNANASSSESLLYIKQANMVRVKLNEIYSRALTIAVRIMGQDAYVEFKYAEIDLRPSSELEAYKTMKQSRILSLLSLGFLPDEEASIMLTGNLPPATFKPLSGTGFMTLGGAANPAPASGTGAIDKTLTPSTPSKPKS